MEYLIKKKFKDKEIVIRQFLKKDFLSVKKFQIYLNTLVEEDAKILMRTKKTLKQEKEWVEDKLTNVKKHHKEVYLLAECENSIVGLCSVKLQIERQDHIGEFGISIGKDFRKIGLGFYLTKEVIKLAKKELKPKIIKLYVFANNTPAIKLYEKIGFKQVAVLPDHVQFQGKLIDEICMLLYL